MLWGHVSSSASVVHREAGPTGVGEHPTRVTATSAAPTTLDSFDLQAVGPAIEPPIDNVSPTVTEELNCPPQRGQVEDTS